MKFSFLITIITIFFLNSCASNFYQVPIAQGNIISLEMLSKLEKGLTKVQVQYIMGTPSVKDPFDSSKWDYIGYEIIGNELLREVHYSLLFQDEKLNKWTKKIDSDSNEDVSGITEKLNTEKSEQ
ncbi:outer membrane protein assembly factor BamE [Gammaproteobacteria bacterium]|nr:outer membrane protein assembly factor BamE [Gammaproteobacteria bacterium]